jgi:hypothetical protein
MRKLLILAVIALVALGIVPAALAGNGHGHGPGDGTGTGICTGTGPGTGSGPQASRTQYSVNGTVTAVGADSLTIIVKSANRAARKSVAKTVVLKITAETLLYERNADRTLVAVTLADFATGDRVTSAGTVDLSVSANPVFTAYRITLLPPVGTYPDCPNYPNCPN